MSGADWISSHDQASASLKEIARTRPEQFILLYVAPDGEAMHSIIFADSSFVATSITVLVEALTMREPTVAPPPDKEEP